MHGVDISHLSNVLIAVALGSPYTYPHYPRSDLPCRCLLSYRFGYTHVDALTRLGRCLITTDNATSYSEGYYATYVPRLLYVCVYQYVKEL